MSTEYPELDNALVEMKNRILEDVNNIEHLQEVQGNRLNFVEAWARIVTTIRHFVPVANATSYGYKMKEILGRVQANIDRMPGSKSEAVRTKIATVQKTLTAVYSQLRDL